MSEYAILIDYEYCTACHTCEVACKQEYDRKAGEDAGVKVVELIHNFGNGKLDLINLPVFTKRCILCAPRVKNGLKPACVQHCMAGCLSFGPLDELVKKMTKKRMAIWKP